MRLFLFLESISPKIPSRMYSLFSPAATFNCDEDISTINKSFLFAISMVYLFLLYILLYYAIILISFKRPLMDLLLHLQQHLLPSPSLSPLQHLQPLYLDNRLLKYPSLLQRKNQHHTRYRSTL